MQFAEPAQIPLHVHQVQTAGLVDSYPDTRHQPGGSEVTGHRRELSAADQLLAPTREQPVDLLDAGRDPQRGALLPARAVDLIDRALDDSPCQNMNLGLVAQFQEAEIGLQRLRPRQRGVPRRRPQRPSEIGVRIGGLHLPQRAPEPRPNLLEIRQIGPNRIVRQPCCRPRKHETRQHIGLETGDLLRCRRNPPITQLAHRGQSHPSLLVFTICARVMAKTIELQKP
ncbi:hypothetical protein [Nocardia wallacei]|uniref:hypothetical protein n=1 Tax=Nocardia wallacei TaxID=480035 RepID=UPI002453B0B9|nr:hypothetical protein [Nocardia wallacei]